MSLSLEEMNAMQQELRKKYSSLWGDLTPEHGRELLLWTMGELSEVADIIKKQGDEKIMSDAATRDHFLEEISDVLMYLTDVTICYDIKPEEIESAFHKKHDINMIRWEDLL